LRGIRLTGRRRLGSNFGKRVAPADRFSRWTYFAGTGEFIEPSPRCVDSFSGPGFFRPRLLGEIDMSKATRVSVSIPVSPTNSDTSKESHPLVWIALFSGIGLLASLIAMLTGVQGVWW
jgi:hypothetical protein